MGGCATKPKVLKGNDTPEPQMPERQSHKEDSEREPVKESKPRDTVNDKQNSDDKVVAKDKGENRTAEINDISNTVDEIVGGDDKVEEQGGKRRSLSLLFDKESQDGDGVTQSDNPPPEELKKQEPKEAEKIIGEAQSNETLKQEATNNAKSSSECGEDKEVSLETQKASGEFESSEPVKHVPAEQEPPAEIVKNEIPTKSLVEKAEKDDSFEIPEQEPAEFVKFSNDPVKNDASNANETSRESDTEFVEAETKLEEPSNVNETSVQSDTEFAEPETKLEEPSNINETSGQSDAVFVGAESKLEEPPNVNETSGESDSKFAGAGTKLKEPTNVNETSGQSDTKFVGAETKLEEPSNVNETSVQPDTKFLVAETKMEEPSNMNETLEKSDAKFVEAETLENPVEQTGTAADVAPPGKDVAEHTNQSAVEVQNDDKIAKETTESSDVKRTSIAPDSEPPNANNKMSGETHSESSDGNNRTPGKPLIESSDVNKISEPHSSISEVKPLEKPGEQIGLALALAPSEEEATEHNNHSAVGVQNDDKPAKTIKE